MRILLVSDLHYRLPQFDWVVRVAPSFDLVVLAGDHLDINSAVSLDAQSVVIVRYLSLLRSAGDVAVSSGNHDLTGPDGQGEQAALWFSEARLAGVPTDGDSLLLGDFVRNHSSDEFCIHAVGLATQPDGLSIVAGILGI